MLGSDHVSLFLASDEQYGYTGPEYAEIPVQSVRPIIRNLIFWVCFVAGDIRESSHLPAAIYALVGRS